MSIGWPDQEEAPKPTAQQRRGSYWGGMWLPPDEVLSGRTRFGAREVAIGLLAVALLLLLGAVLWVYGPLPQLFPRDCLSCFFYRS